MILTLGCSFTYGDELEDPQQAWPCVLANRLGTDVHNVGQSGNSNDAMLRQLIKLVSTGTYELVVVAWTNPDRFETWNEFNQQLDNIIPASETKLPWLEDYYRYSYNQHYSLLRWLQQVLMAQAWLKTRQQPYVFVNVSGLHDPPQLANLVYITEQFDLDRYVGWPSRGLIEIATGTPVGAGGHFLQLGHERVADEIAKHIRA